MCIDIHNFQNRKDYIECFISDYSQAILGQCSNMNIKQARGFIMLFAHRADKEKLLNIINDADRIDSFCEIFKQENQNK